MWLMTTSMCQVEQKYQQSGLLLRYTSFSNYTCILPAAATLCCFLCRHYSIRNIQFKVMYGAMVVCCTKFGVWDISHLKENLQMK